jgi:hypothetical protein
VSRKAAAACLVVWLAALPGAALAQVDLSAPPSGEAPGQETPTVDHRDPAMVMFDNYFISLVAARKCGNPDEATMSAFVRNLLIVQQIAIDSMKKQMPGKSNQEVAEVLNARAEKLDMLVNDAIQTKGCTSPEIGKLVDSFAVNAKMDFEKK